MSFIAGMYTLTAGASPGAAGQLKQGLKIQHVHYKQLIKGDNMAEATQDAVNRGVDMFIDYTLIEYNAARALSLFWPLSSTIYDMGVIGRLDSGIASQIILTALAGTPAAATPATITFPLAILAEGFPLDILYAPELREVPIRQRLYPNSSRVFGTTT